MQHATSSKGSAASPYRFALQNALQPCSAGLPYRLALRPCSAGLLCRLLASLALQTAMEAAIQACLADNREPGAQHEG
eukprot:388453-Pelagomonas_calceolata.AAC.2